jgi:hypothetical protein
MARLGVLNSTMYFPSDLKYILVFALYSLNFGNYTSYLVVTLHNSNH